MNNDIETLLSRENLQLATVRSRAAAFGIDELLLSTLLFIILWDSISTATSVEAIILVINRFILEYIAIKIVYQTFFTMQYGATLGKIMMKIRIINTKTLANPGFLSAFNRSVFRIVSEMLFYLGFAWAIFDPYRRTWHDLSAQTLVVDA
jgi:uncharacterized RDD family membrane protein YckC